MLADNSTRSRPHTSDHACAMIRRRILEMARTLNGAHYGGCLSCVEILYAIYRRIADSEITAHEPDRTFVILGKGHAALTQYAALEQRFGWQFGTGIVPSFSCHPTRHSTWGIETASGSLGHGLAIGCGRALWGIHHANSAPTYVILGDGECQEGSIWEAALFASRRRLSNLLVVIDRNGFQQCSATDDSTLHYTSPEAWRAIGWDVQILDGHDVDALDQALSSDTSMCLPRVILADTIKGKGISFLEGTQNSHFCTLSNELWHSALAEIEIFLR